MYNFQNDYAEGAHPRILARLQTTNLAQQMGYGEDEYSSEAKKLIRQKIQNPRAAVYFVSGGTQANLLVISSLLRIHEAVISANTGHIATHEAGSIEATGHRVITVPAADGKLTPAAVATVLEKYTMRPHVLKPKMVYISNATETGTLYTKTELVALKTFCEENDLWLFMDGARLGAALTAETNDLTLPEIAQLTDIFYIGGTKNGALLGEAVVFTDNQLNQEFDYAIKQKGAMLAKGRLLGIQFLELFTDNLYFELAAHANAMATELAARIEKAGYSFSTPPVTNQVFPIFSHSVIKKLRQNYCFHEWEKIDEQHSAVRLVTSWATSAAIIDKFVRDLGEC